MDGPVTSVLSAVDQQKQLNKTMKTKVSKATPKPKKNNKRNKKSNRAKLENYFLPKDNSFCENEAINDLAVEVLLDVTPQKRTDIKNESEDCLVNDHEDASSRVVDQSSVGYLKMSPYSSAGKTTSKKRNTNANKSCNIKTEIDVHHGQTSVTESTALTKRASSTSSKQKKTSKVRKQEDSKKITEFFPIRRSSRKTKSIIKKEKEDLLIEAVLSNREEHLEVVEFTSKGRGVIATKNFTQGEFVVEYAGDLITWPEAKQRELQYSMDSAVGCYMYYFHARQQNFCIDATAESGRYGRLLNHSRRSPNCHTRLVWIPDVESGEEEPHLVILAKRNIEKDEELTYDYGDRDKSALEVHPWLKL